MVQKNIFSNSSSTIPSPEDRERLAREDVLEAMRLIPMDLNSESEVNELRIQRQICGWGIENIPKWKISCNEKKNILYWITLPKSFSTFDANLVSTKAKRTLLTDWKEAREEDQPNSNNGTKTLPLAPASTFTLSNGQYLETNNDDIDPEKYILAGHVGLGLPALDLGHPMDGSVLNVNNLFVAPRWRALRLAVKAMDLVERVAAVDPFVSSSNTSSPAARTTALYSTSASTSDQLRPLRPIFNSTTKPCRYLILDTAHRRYHEGSESLPTERGIWKLLGALEPSRGASAADWYIKRGYKHYREPEGRYDHQGVDGKWYQFVAVFLRKGLMMQEKSDADGAGSLSRSG